LLLADNCKQYICAAAGGGGVDQAWPRVAFERWPTGRVGSPSRPNICWYRRALYGADTPPLLLLPLPLTGTNADYWLAV